jgi:methyl-accepting chemotaxis protein
MSLTDDRADALEMRRDPWRNGSGRRWLILSIGGLILGGGHLLGHVPTPPTTIVIALALSAGGLVILPTLVRRLDGVAQAYVLGAADLALITVILALHGPRGLSVIFFLAVLPYAVRAPWRLGTWLAVAAGVAFLVSSILHAWSFPGTTEGTAAEVLLEAGLFVAVALVLVRVAGSTAQRLRSVRSIVADATAGNLAMRADVRGDDEMGLTEQALNALLVKLEGTVRHLRTELRDIGALADVSAKTLDRIL